MPKKETKSIDFLEDRLLLNVAYIETQKNALNIEICAKHHSFNSHYFYCCTPTVYTALSVMYICCIG
jgi:hypothetical protein